MSSLSEMMAALHAMERVHDDSEEITEEQIAEHFDQVKEIDKKVDNIDAFMSMCKANAALYSERAEALELKALRFENMAKRCESYVLHLINRYPEVEFRGNTVQFKKKLNPVALQCPVIANKSFSAVINPEAVESIPENYRVQRTVWQLETSKTKDAIKHGDPSINFASLRQSEKLVTEYKLPGEK